MRNRMSFSPDPSSSRTPTPVMRAGSSASTSSRLSKEEIDEILDSPYETKYTYSDSAAYKPHIGSHNYVHPRLCRRFPATQSPPLSASNFLSPSGTATTSWPPTSVVRAWQNNWRRSQHWTWTELLVYVLQFLTIFAYTVVQYSAVRVYYGLRYLFTRTAWYIIKYTVLWPILAPYYAAVSYYNKARFVWRTTHNVWTVISWTFALLTGGQRRRYATGEAEATPMPGVNASSSRNYYTTATPSSSSAAADGSGAGASGMGLRTRAMARQRGHMGAPEDGAAAFAAARAKDDQQPQLQHLGKWLFYSVLLLLLLFAGYTLYGDRRFRLANKQPIETVEQIHGQPDQEQLLKLKPSDELHQTHLAHPGTPKTAIVMDQPELHFTPSLHPAPRTDEITPQPQFVYNTTASYTFYEHLTKAGQSVWELVVDTIVGTYELLKRLFFVIVSMPIKFAKMIAHFVRVVIASVWHALQWLAKGIAELPSSLVSPVKGAVQFRAQNLTNSAIEFGRSVYRTVTQWFTMMANAIGAHLLSLWHALRWTVFQFSHMLSFAFDVIYYAGQKVIDGFIYAIASVHWFFANVANSFSFAMDSVINLFWFTVEKIGHALTMLRDGVVNIALFTTEKIENIISMVRDNAFQLFRTAYQKIGHALTMLRDGVVNIALFTTEKFGNAISMVRDNAFQLFWTAYEKIGNTLVFLRDNVANLVLSIFEKIRSAFGFVRKGLVVVVWGTVEKIFTVLSVLLHSIAHFFASIYNACAQFLLNIWQSVRFSPAATKVENLLKKAQNVKDDVVLSPSAVDDDHPLIQHFHRLLTDTLAEERAALEQKLHDLAEQQQQTTRKASPSVDGNALKDNLRNELDLKMRIEKEELNKTVNHFEEQILSKIRTLIEQMDSQKDNLEHEIDEVRRTQLELKKDVEETGKPLLKKEKIIQQLKEDGRTETIKESTVLMAQKQQQQQQQQQIAQQFDEGQLLEKVRQMIREELRRFDADRTGIVDYALESSGGSVLSTRCTVQYNERSRIQKLFGIPLWYTGYSPRTVIQRKGYGASAGECWAFYGGHGYLTIGLSHRINVTAVSYEHLPAELSPDRQIRSAPRNFLVWSYQDVDDMDTRLLLGNFTYDAEGGEPLQMFPVQQWDPHGTQIIELETLTNWGAQVTCLYRFRVHGDIMMEILRVASADDLASSSLNSKRWSGDAPNHKEIGGG